MIFRFFFLRFFIFHLFSLHLNTIIRHYVKMKLSFSSFLVTDFWVEFNTKLYMSNNYVRWRELWVSTQAQSEAFKMKTDLNESMLRTLGALGMIINNEFAKKVIRRRASKFMGTLIADSFTVKSKWSLTTCIIEYETKRGQNTKCWMIISESPVPFPSRTSFVRD